MILCTDGTALLRRYQQAAQDRADARDEFRLLPETSEEALFKAKESYDQAFVAWVTHRGDCTVCRTTSDDDDLTQFASV